MASAARIAWRARSGTGSRPDTSARSGSTSCRMRLRTNLGSSFIGSARVWRPRASQRARVSWRRSASSGRRSGEPMPAAPGTPAPLSRFRSTVSAWSSAVCPVRMPGGHAARRASRARASRFGPSSTGASTHREEAPRPVASRATMPPSAEDPDLRPWSTCQAVTTRSASTASTSSAVESGPPETAQSTSVPGGGKLHRSNSSATDMSPMAGVRSDATTAAVNPPGARPGGTPSAQSRGRVGGSRPGPAGARGPPRPCPGGPCHRVPPRRR